MPDMPPTHRPLGPRLSRRVWKREMTTGGGNRFKRVWAYREDTLYPSRFGPDSVGIFPLPAKMLTETF